MIEIDSSLPPELIPLSWLIGVWEGTGVINYPVGDEVRNSEFGQRVSFSHDGLPFLNYSATSWLLDGDDNSSIESAPLTAETGFWRLSRPFGPGDPGPGMLPSLDPAPFSTMDAVETLRVGDGFDVEASIVHPDGVSELYLGRAAGPRIDLATDAVLRPASAREHSASTRLYGLVEGHLLWAWDIAALGQPLTSHASARLARVD